MEQVFVNGNFVAIADASISIFDRGLLFGDSIYEVIPVYANKVYFYEQHLARLQANLDAVKIPMPKYNWQGIFQQLIESNTEGDLQIYVQITRGNQGVRKIDIPKQLEPTVIVFALHADYPTAAEKQKGVSAKLLEDNRWMHCDIKTNSLIANVLLNDAALSSGFDTSILHRNGIITEGSASNIFIVSDGHIKTPKLSKFCLPGITRKLVLELIPKLNLQLSEIDIDIKELFTAQEVWLTSTTKEIYPITKIDDHTVGNGKAGIYWLRMHEAYQEMKNTSS